MMRSHRIQNDGFQRKTAFHFPSQQRRYLRDREFSSNGWMFIEDVSHRVMPIGGRARHRPEFTIGLTPDDPDLREIIADAFVARGQRSGYRLTEDLSKFIEEAAYHVAYYGVVHYEVVPWRTPAGQEDAHQAASEPAFLKHRFRAVIIPGRILKIGTLTLQMIPRADRAQLKLKKRFIRLAPDEVWTMRLPAQLGTPRSHRVMMRALARASTTFPSFAMERLAKPVQATDFTFHDFRSQQEVATARETSRWGWPGRDMWREQTQEYYTIYRELRFAYSMALLREHVMSKMNELLEQRSFPAGLIMKGLPVANEIGGYIEQLQKGKISFAEARRLIEI